MAGGRWRDLGRTQPCEGSPNVAALERSDNVADRGHAFAELKRGYTHQAVIVQESEMRAMDGVMHGFWLRLRRVRPSVVKLWWPD